MSDTKTEIKEGKDYDERKSKLSQLSNASLVDMIYERPPDRYTSAEFQNDLIDIILEHNLDLE
jgi:hypothetical protein